MDIFSFTVGPFAENTYLLAEGSKAVLIDPGFSSQSELMTFRDALEKSESELRAVLLTHAHVDHVLGLRQVLRTHEVPVYLNHNDLYLWNNFESQSAMFGIQAAGFNFIPEPLEEQSGFSVAGITFDIFYTPGHSPDHISLYIKNEGVLIAGDVLFRESIGRTDLYKGDFDLLAASVKEKLYKLPGDTKVLPGHGPATTIGYEKKNNAFVREDAADRS